MTRNLNVAILQCGHLTRTRTQCNLSYSRSLHFYRVRLWSFIQDVREEWVRISQYQQFFPLPNISLNLYWRDYFWKANVSFNRLPHTLKDLNDVTSKKIQSAFLPRKIWFRYHCNTHNRWWRGRRRRRRRGRVERSRRKRRWGRIGRNWWCGSSRLQDWC